MNTSFYKSRFSGYLRVAALFFSLVAFARCGSVKRYTAEFSGILYSTTENGKKTLKPFEKVGSSQGEKEYFFTENSDEKSGKKTFAVYIPRVTSATTESSLEVLVSFSLKGYSGDLEADVVKSTVSGVSKGAKLKLSKNNGFFVLPVKVNLADLSNSPVLDFKLVCKAKKSEVKNASLVFSFKSNSDFVKTNTNAQFVDAMKNKLFRPDGSVDSSNISSNNEAHVNSSLNYLNSVMSYFTNLTDKDIRERVSVVDFKKDSNRKSVSKGLMKAFHGFFDSFKKKKVDGSDKFYVNDIEVPADVYRSKKYRTWKNVSKISKKALTDDEQKAIYKDILASVAMFIRDVINNGKNHKLSDFTLDVDDQDGKQILTYNVKTEGESTKSAPFTDEFYDVLDSIKDENKAGNVKIKRDAFRRTYLRGPNTRSTLYVFVNMMSTVYTILKWAENSADTSDVEEGQKDTESEDKSNAVSVVEYVNIDTALASLMNRFVLKNFNGGKNIYKISVEGKKSDESNDEQTQEGEAPKIVVTRTSEKNVDIKKYITQSLIKAFVDVLKPDLSSKSDGNNDEEVNNEDNNNSQGQ